MIHFTTDFNFRISFGDDFLIKASCIPASLIPDFYSLFA